MIDAKFKECGLNSSRTIGMPACDKQQLPFSKKTALRDVQNETQNRICKPLETSILKDAKPVVETVKVCGDKRPRPESPTSLTCTHSLFSNINGTNGHHVYVRRKTEVEPGKLVARDMGSNDTQQSREVNNDKRKPHGQQNQLWEPKYSCFPAFAPMPVASLTTLSSGGPSVPYSLGNSSNGLAVSEPNYLMPVTTGIPSIVPHRLSNLNWTERFVRLQMFLQQCDQSSQEDYIKMLRSLSAAGRSSHAFELEKRAVHLLIEEGKELRRMKVLNALGKSIPTNHP